MVLYLRDLEVVHLSGREPKPRHCVECLSPHGQERIRNGGEDLTKGFNAPSVYLVPTWTPTRRLANVLNKPNLLKDVAFV